MNFFQQIFSNRVLMAGLAGWAVAQILKALIYRIVNGEFSLERLFGDGGMPSGHSATVTSAALMCGLQNGFDSPIFAVMFLLAIIVMHDAMGVRLETGKQAKAINTILEMMEDMGREDLTPEEKLKEFVGHTPTQVLAGAGTGLVTAILLQVLVYH